MRALFAAMHSLFLAACTENIHAMLRSKEKGKNDADILYCLVI
jgi:hypothetical protein